MPPPAQSFVRNSLLSTMDPGDFRLLAPHLERLPMPKDMALADAGVEIEHVYFMESGLGSIVASIPANPTVEVGLFGRDGMGCVAPLLDVRIASHRIVVQIGGEGYRLPVGALTDALEQSRTLHRLLLRYVMSLVTQSDFTALSNATQTIEERLARWLLMSHDRVDGDELPLTHEFLAIMLGVRRPSVTTALHVLEGEHLIRARRGLITVRDRDGLIGMAGGAYGTPERVYREQIGPLS